MSKQVDKDIDNIPHIIFACCVLHNVCEVHGDNFNDKWLLEVDTLMAQPDDEHPVRTTLVSGGDQVRQILVDYFKCNNLNSG